MTSSPWGRRSGLANDAAPVEAWALVSPFHNPTNPYNDAQKRLLAALGYRLLPFSVRTIFSRELRRLFSRDNLIVLNWTESRAFRWRQGHARLSVAGLAIFAFYIAVLLVARARVLYFVHDHAVHDTSGWQRQFSAWLVRLLCRIATVRGVLDPTSAGPYRAEFLPHPLLGNLAPDERGPRPTGATRRFLIIGAIRPYKALEGVLEAWPAGLHLDIVGRADPDYARTLAAVVERRGLAPQVRIEPGFIDEAELERRLAEADVLILPHRAGSALVSSAFFEAIGRVPVILARGSPFNQWIADRFPSLRCFASDAELAALAAQAATEAEPPPLVVTLHTAEALFGDRACERAYACALGRTRLGAGPKFGCWPKLERPTVSVVIPNHNYARFLDQAIGSALDQTWPSAEVIVVDDGSTDESREIMARYGTRIVSIHRPQGGQIAACNDGLANCTGDVVVFLDADDYLDSAALAQIAMAFDEGVVKVHFPMRLVDAEGRALGPCIPRRLAVGDQRPALLRGLLYNSAPGSGNAYRRAALQPLLPLPADDLDRHGADYFLIYGTSMLGTVAALPGPLASYRVHARPGQLHFGNASVTANRAVRRGQRLREWLRARIGAEIAPPDPRKDFSVQKLLFAQRALEPASYRARLHAGLSSVPALIPSLLAYQGWFFVVPLMLLWATFVSVAPRSWAWWAAIRVCNPAARGGIAGQGESR